MILIELAKKDIEWRQMAFYICKDKNLADDLVQEMYLRLANLDKKRYAQPSYVYTTIRSIFIDTLRSKKNNYILIDDFSKFELLETEYIEPIDYVKLSKGLTWYEKTMFELSTFVGQRELSRRTEIPLQTIHRVNKMVKKKLNGKKKD